ncbi:hypothetical protein [Bacteroides sedimenti]
MKSIITQSITEQGKTKKSNEAETNLQPGKRTIDFLKQFARNYHVEPTMPQGLQGVFLG